MSAHATPAATTTPAANPTPPGLLGRYNRRFGLLVFWVAVMILGFMVVTPHPTAVWVMVFAITVLALDYVLFGGGTFWRPMVVRGAALALALSMLSFLAPPNYVDSIPSRDAVGQKLVDRGLIGGAWDGVKTLAFGKSAENPDSNVASEEEELLLLRFECYTPCSAPVTFPARFKYEGSILNVQYPGVTNPVSYYRNVPGTKSAPTGVLKGETFFTSGDPNNPNFRVQVFERIRR